MGVYSDGSYGAPAGVIYSFPVTCKDGKWSIVQVRPGRCWGAAGLQGCGGGGCRGLRGVQGACRGLAGGF